MGHRTRMYLKMEMTKEESYASRGAGTPQTKRPDTPRSSTVLNMTASLLVIIALLLLDGLGGATGYSPVDGSRRDHFYEDSSGSRKMTRNINQRLIVTTLLEPPYMMLKVDGAFLTGNDRFEGYLADMMAAIAEGAGIDYQIRLTSDGTLGHVNENGNWTGMIGDLVKGEADIAAGPLVYTEAREKVVDFTVPFMTFRSSALIRIPKRKRNRNRIQNAQDLLKSHMPYGVITNSVTQSQFMGTWNATYRQMWAKMATSWPSTFVGSIQEGVSRARRERYGFILDSPAAEYLAGRKPCDLYTIEPFLDLKHYVFGVRKGSRLRQQLNSQLQIMQSNQKLQTIYLKWWRSECLPKPEPTMRQRDLRTPDYHGRSQITTPTDPPNPWRYATAGVSPMSKNNSGFSTLITLTLSLVTFCKRASISSLLLERC